MILQINDSCRIQTDTYNWIIRVPAGTESEERDGWKSVLFYPTPQLALKHCVTEREKFATLAEASKFQDFIEMVESTERELRLLDNLDLGKSDKALDPPLIHFARKLGLLRDSISSPYEWTFMSLRDGATYLLHLRLRQIDDLDVAKLFLEEAQLLIQELPGRHPWGKMNRSMWGEYNKARVADRMRAEDDARLVSAASLVTVTLAEHPAAQATPYIDAPNRSKAR